MRSIEVSAKTVDLAVEKGLQMLGATKEQVKINIIEKETMLKKAKIEVVLFESEEEKKVEENKKPDQKTVLNQIKQVSVEEDKTTRFELNELEQKIADTLKSFIEKLLNIINVEGKIGFKGLDNDLCVTIDGEQLGILIGHHGDTLDAMQTLISTFVKNEFPDYKNRVYVDIENYRAKRTDALCALAKRMATKVVQIKKSLKLEAMSANERRIIHLSLQDIPNITTHSEGNEPNRYLVIDYVD